MRVNKNMVNRNYGDRSHSIAVNEVLNKKLIIPVVKETAEESLPRMKIKLKLGFLEKRLL